MPLEPSLAVAMASPAGLRSPAAVIAVDRLPQTPALRRLDDQRAALAVAEDPERAGGVVVLHRLGVGHAVLLRVEMRHERAARRVLVDLGVHAVGDEVPIVGSVICDPLGIVVVVGDMSPNRLTLCRFRLPGT